MTFTVSGIPMTLIPHPQGAWLEGITPVTNLQWRRGVEPLIRDGARYCLLEPHYRGDLMARQFGNLEDVLDTVGRGNIPRDWDGLDVIDREVPGRGVLALSEWRPRMSRKNFDRDQQPVVDVNWYHAKGWTLAQTGLHLLTSAQWIWSARGGERNLRYATATGALFGPDGRKLAHFGLDQACGGADRNEETTIDVDDPKYPDGPFGLRHKTGNVEEWVERDFSKEFPYGQQGGSFQLLCPDLRIRDWDYIEDNGRYYFTGFRVGAAAPEGLGQSQDPKRNKAVRIRARSILRELQLIRYREQDIRTVANLFDMWSLGDRSRDIRCQRRLRILAKSVFRDLQQEGFTPEEMLRLSRLLKEWAGGHIL
jgi:formylglycine-generating enzyme required for sulfatase activity